jgi:predicted ATPase/transcriptional regulator with XRE-family HTH domain
MEGQNAPVVFSDWLKRRRKALDLTQDELAKRAGCSLGALRKIEAGERRPSKQLAVLLAQALDIPQEEQQAFIRVARGDLNLERLRAPSPATPSSLPDLSLLQGTPKSTVPGAGSRPPANRIPLQTTPLVGRESELDALERLFNDPQCRLLTLIGIGGIGKTRLAIEFAAKHLSGFPGGVFYIPLTPVDSLEKIVPAIADGFDFAFSGPSDPKEQLLNYISTCIDEKALFILDNLEHLLVQVTAGESEPGLVKLVSEILGRAPGVHILGTSRERLNLHGEWIYELHGLSVPPTHYVGGVEEYNSVALFLRSAQRVKADFQTREAEQAALVRICQMVDGVPLALELAAAWVGILSCQEIAQEIGSNMDFLTTSMRDIPERHRSIRATFDHSWKLLADEERRALCQLSVFHGGFSRSAAGQVAGASLALLASLSAKSLVRRTESGRYDLHEVIRQYALSHLHDQPGSLTTFERHCEYYLALLGEHEKLLKNASQQEAIRRLTDEIDNIRAAWDWAIRHKKYALLGQAGRAFGWYFEITGLYGDGIEQFETLARALQARPESERWQRLLGLAHLHQGLLYFRKGEFDQASRHYEASIAVLRPTGDQVLLADALIFLGIILHLNGDYARATASEEEGLALARAAGEPWFEAFAIYNLGHLAGLMGHYAEGYEQMVAAVNTWRSLGDPHMIALGLNFMIPILSKLGKYEEAKAFMQESIALCEITRNRWGMGTAYGFLGLACIAGGQYGEAKAHLRKSLEVFGDYFTGWNIARSLTYLGDATRLDGDDLEARKIYLEALRLSIEGESIPIALDALSGMSCLQAQAGEAEKALLLCCIIIDHPSSEEETKLRAAGLRAELEGSLDCDQIAAAYTKAAGISFDEIVMAVRDADQH